MKLLIEEDCREYNTIYENDVSGNKTLFIEGVFMQADKKNRNGRVYPKRILEKEVQRYITEDINTHTAYGELNHPATPSINPERVSHLVVSLKEDGNDYIGKAKILETPMGNICRKLMEGGGQLSVSSRGTGTLKNTGGYLQVQEDYRIHTCADIVIKPSLSIAQVKPIYESIMDSPDWFYDNIKNEWVASKIHEEFDTSLNEERLIKQFNRMLNVIKNQ